MSEYTKEQLEDMLLGQLEQQLSVDEKDSSEVEKSTLKEKKRKRASARWVPTEWRVEYEQVVALSVIGKTGIEIAAMTGYTPQHVYNILATPTAIEIQKRLIEKIRQRTRSIAEEIDEIEKLTVRRLRESLQDEETFKKYPMGLIGKGLEVMKGKGEHLKHAPTTQVNNTTFNLPASVAEKFLAGLEKANTALLLNSGEKVEEAEFDVVEDGKNTDT